MDGPQFNSALSKGRNRLLPCLCAIFALAVPTWSPVLTGLWAAEPQLVIAIDHHPWGRFPCGSWKKVRVTTENFDNSGRIVSTSATETTTTLVAVDETGYTLRIESVVEVAGKRFVAQPQVIRSGFCGDDGHGEVQVEAIGEGHVTVGDEPIPTRIFQITDQRANLHRVSTIYYSPDVEPFVLKRDIVSANGGDAQPVTTTHVQVVAREMPYKVLSEFKTVSFVQITHEGPAGKTITLEIQAGDVPGGVVAHSSREVNAEGKLIRRSTLELLDYGVGRQGPLKRLLDHLRSRPSPD